MSPGGPLARLDRMRFAKILCPTDFSRGADQALRVAERIARASDAELVIAHAWDMPPTEVGAALGFARPEEQAAEARHELEEVDAKDAARKLLHGTAWREIVSLLEKEAFDLCVIGSRGRTGIHRVLLGSVAEKVVRHAPCSVMTVRADGEEEVKPFMHALVPTDFSASARQALASAASMVPAKGLITLMHVLEVPASHSGIVPDEIGRELDRKVTHALKRELEEVEHAARAETTYRVGYPGAETLAAIDRDKTIDLVVMGANGRSGIKRAIIGTVAEKTVRHARCPVLVTRRR